MMPLYPAKRGVGTAKQARWGQPNSRIRLVLPLIGHPCCLRGDARIRQPSLALYPFMDRALQLNLTDPGYLRSHLHHVTAWVIQDSMGSCFYMLLFGPVCGVVLGSLVGALLSPPPVQATRPIRPSWYR